MAGDGSPVVEQLITERLKFRSVVAVILGFGVAFAGRWPDVHSVLDFVQQIVLPELGLALVIGGVVEVLIDYRNRRHSQALVIEQQRQVFREEAAVLSDATLENVGNDPDRLRKIFSTEMLERFAVNSMIALWGSAGFVRDMFTELRDLVVSAPERWRNVTMSVRLSPWTEGPALGLPSMFAATVRWEYRVVPGMRELRFVCVSDPDEHQRLSRDPSVTFAWLWSQPAPLPVDSPEVFQLTSVIINGLPWQAHRTSRSDAQIYTVSLPDTPDGDELVVSFTYRVLVQRDGHLLWLDVPRPAHGLAAEFRYDDTDIRQLTVLDQLASPRPPRIDHTESLPEHVINLGYDGWIRPHSGVAFCWTLADEPATSTPGPPAPPLAR